jgi:hypothetical protein
MASLNKQAFLSNYVIPIALRPGTGIETATQIYHGAYNSFVCFNCRKTKPGELRVKIDFLGNERQTQRIPNMASSAVLMFQLCSQSITTRKLLPDKTELTMSLLQNLALCSKEATIYRQIIR